MDAHADGRARLRWLLPMKAENELGPVRTRPSLRPSRKLSRAKAWTHLKTLYVLVRLMSSACRSDLGASLLRAFDLLGSTSRSLQIDLTRPGVPKKPVVEAGSRSDTSTDGGVNMLRNGAGVASRRLSTDRRRTHTATPPR